MPHDEKAVRHSRLPITLTTALFCALVPLRVAEAWGAPPMCLAEPEALWSDAYRACGVNEMQLPAAPLALYHEAPDVTAMSRARRHLAEGDFQEAIDALSGIEAHFPRIADHIALLRAEAAFGGQMHDIALAAYGAALRSEDGTVRLRARVGRVRTLLALDRPEAARELGRLLRAYPELPERQLLRLEHAASVEREGNLRRAADMFRALDYELPGTSIAARAREHLDALAARGVAVAPFSDEERVARGEQLVSVGPMGEARSVIDALLEDRTLSRELRRRVCVMAARLARLEGRFGDRERLLEMARTGAMTLEEEPEPSEEERERAAREEVRRLQRGALARAPNFRLVRVAQVAAREGLEDIVDGALRVAIARRAPPQVRYELALVASGGAHDEKVAALLEPLTKLGGDLGRSARYHYARALHRLGRLDEAKQAYQRVRTVDRDGLGYYAMWAGLELARLREERAARAPLGGEPELTQVAMVSRTPPLRPAAMSGVASSRVDASDEPRSTTLAAAHAPRMEGFAHNRPRRRHPPVNYGALADRLRGVAEVNGEGYPQLARAVDLLRLGQIAAAQNEIYEAFLGWRAVNGRPLRRVGLEAVARGAERPREAISAQVRRARARLSDADRHVIGQIAAAIGDYGTAVGIDPEIGANDRPRAYEREVEAAAATFGLDPNLLLAVMRVESVYQRSIVSYAGAIGLTQIMPRTGRLIAHELGERDFTTADLLDPTTNLRFSAWYLASLIRRFDGRLPLAIASYNGGPHNVRAWIEEHAETMPLDALLERIPFTQTHRYVRRVLTHYAAYRAQRGLPMERLEDTLPTPRADRIAF